MVVVGDEPSSTSGYDSQHQIRLEDTPLFASPVQLDASQEYMMGAAVVEVTDGKLTMDPLGGFNTKPAYIEIQAITAGSNGNNTVVFDELTAGSYDVTELSTAGWQLDGVTCDGDLDSGSAVAGNTVTIDLDAGEDITCTFVNVEAPTNTPPVADDQIVTVDENDSAPITLTGSDADTGDTLSFAIATQPTNGTLDVTNLPDVVYTPDADYSGPDSFTFVVNDGTEDSAPATVSITVNEVNAVPVADAQSVTVDENDSAPITLTGSDADTGDTLSFAIATQPTNGTLDVTNLPDVVYTPDANYSGPDSFTFVVNDGTEDSAPATVSITVNEVNAVPVADAQSVTVDENDSAPITLTGSDADTGDTLSFAIATQPTNGTLDVTNLPDVVYTPDADYSGPDSFTFVVNDGTEDSVAATVSITVEPIVIDTVCAPISTLTCDQIAVSLPFGLDWAGDEGGLDDSNDIGTGFTMAMAPSARLAADGTPTFADAPGYEPSKLTVAGDLLSIEATKGIFFRDPNQTSDTNSQINGLGVGIDVPTEAIVIETTLTDTNFAVDGNNFQQAGLWFGLDEDNVAKLIVHKTSNTNAKVQLQVEDYLTNAPSVDPSDTQIEVTNIGNPANLDVTLRMVLDPATNEVTGFFSTDGVTFTQVSDNIGDTLTANAAFFTGVDHDADSSTPALSYAGVHSSIRRGTTPITYNFTDFSIDLLNPPTNTPPVADAQSVTVTENSSVSITLTGSDVDVDDTLTFAIDGQPSNGTVVLTGDQALYTPNADYTGPDSFTFVVNDGTEDSAPATVSITVEPEQVQTATLNGTVTTQGRTLDNSGTLTVGLYDASGTQVGSNYTPTADTAGNFSISGIAPGTYQVAVKGSNTLQVVDTVTLAVGANSADFGQMLGGDASGDNFISTIDFSILAASFGQTAADSGYDARADFNADGIVTTLDFSILAANFGSLGETPTE